LSISTDIPARLDRLPWSRFHVLVVTALGITWILDGQSRTSSSACSRTPARSQLAVHPRRDADERSLEQIADPLSSEAAA
jgi:hypothetical protein